jgi:hypothetical protein
MIRNPKDFWPGVIFTAIGLSAIVFGWKLPLGTTMLMGPAYFPTAIGILLVLIGIAAILRSLFRDGDPLTGFAAGKITVVLGAILLFGLLLRRMGLIISIILLVIISAYASQRFRWPIALALAVGIAGFCMVVFVKMLGLPIPLLGAWFGG